MGRKYIILLFFWIIVTGFSTSDFPEEHAIYISVIKVKHQPDELIATMHIRVFADDLKNALRNEFGYETISEKETFCADYTQKITKYFAENFSLEVNKKQISFMLSNCERVEDVFQLEFKMDCPKEWNSAVLTPRFFMELFPKQSNVVHIEAGSLKRFGRATKGNEVLRIQF